MGPYAPDDPWPGMFAPAEERNVLIDIVQEHTCIKNNDDAQVESRTKAASKSGCECASEGCCSVAEV